MSQAVQRTMGFDEFEVWQSHQDVRCELVEGQPVAMTGATFAHDIVVSNLSFALGVQLRAKGSGCRAFTADIGLVTGPNTLRRPDVAVYCPPFDGRASRSDKPVLVAEVASASTELVDQLFKVDEYRALASLQTILLVEPERLDIGVWERHEGAAWIHRRLTGNLAATLDIPGLGLSLAVADIYDGVTLPPVTGPRLVWTDDPPQR